MKEIKDIVKAAEQAQQSGVRAALATVVHVDGSSYRRPGARMLVTEDGRLTGAISGGCLEGDALRKALLAIHQQQNKLVTYDTTHDDDLQFGVQLGCNGIVHILFEPIRNDAPDNPISLLKELTSERKNAVLVTLFSFDRNHQQHGTCLICTETSTRTSLPDNIHQSILEDIRMAFKNKRSHFREFPSFNGFIEFIPPPPALVIAGAGNDILPLVEIASLLGWHTTVVDGRSHQATTERFPKADKVFVAKPEQVLPQITTGHETLFLLMTHNYNYDLALLAALMLQKAPYIGVLGPRSKLHRMLDDLQSQGILPDEQQLASLHGPVGLDIGAETPQEIAISIVAEIKAFLSCRNGQALKDIPYPIHHRQPLYSTHE